MPGNPSGSGSTGRRRQSIDVARSALPMAGTVLCTVAGVGILAFAFLRAPGPDRLEQHAAVAAEPEAAVLAQPATADVDTAPAAVPVADAPGVVAPVAVAPVAVAPVVVAPVAELAVAELQVADLPVADLPVAVDVPAPIFPASLSWQAIFGTHTDPAARRPAEPDVDDSAERRRQMRAAAERQRLDAAAHAAKAAGVHQPAGAAQPPRRQLNPEQLNVARFISSQYRIAVDASGEFVYHAFRAARDIKVDPLLILAVMSVESSFNPLAQSSKGAQGLMQVLTRVHADRFMPFGGITAAFDPVANIRVGSTILKEYLEREGSVEGALKSYVGAALLAHDNGYGAKVLGERERIAAAAAGLPVPVPTSTQPARRAATQTVPAAAGGGPQAAPSTLATAGETNGPASSGTSVDVTAVDPDRAGYPRARTLSDI
jgi:soluble lytic murein transglycosylase-like protein